MFSISAYILSTWRLLHQLIRIKNKFCTEKTDKINNIKYYITKIKKNGEREKCLGCQDRYQASSTKFLPLSLGQHKAKTQPRQANMIADDSRLPHSSFDSSHLLPTIPISSTNPLSSRRPTKKEKPCRNMDPQLPSPRLLLLLLLLLRNSLCAKYT